MSAPNRTTVQLPLRVPPAVREAYDALAVEARIHGSELVGALLAVGEDAADAAGRSLAELVRDAAERASNNRPTRHK